ncbi:hypothetical protein E4U14_001802 [Claviceps sp. LM454 group G7]|nr:hypothetical protein E4U14_001802 [Claviceps sp. LM454 group G7]
MAKKRNKDSSLDAETENNYLVLNNGMDDFLHLHAHHACPLPTKISKALNLSQIRGKEYIDDDSPHGLVFITSMIRFRSTTSDINYNHIMRSADELSMQCALSLENDKIGCQMPRPYRGVERAEELIYGLGDVLNHGEEVLVKIIRA